MAEYIERGALLAAYDEAHKGAAGGARKLMVEAPAADVVEVVRCKDCKWWGKAGCAIYIVDETDKPKECDFCSFGERRDSDGT